MPSTARRFAVALTLAALPLLAACGPDTAPPAAGPSSSPSWSTLDLGDVLGVPPAGPSTSSAPTAGDVPPPLPVAAPAPAAPAPDTAPPAAPRRTSPAPAPAAPAAPAAPHVDAPPAVQVEPPAAPAPVADPCYRQDPECYGPETIADCLAAQVWDGVQCVEAQLDDERIGRQVDGPAGLVCTVVAVNPDRLVCAPHPAG